MNPVDFRYIRASTVDKAVLASADTAGEAKVIAGGQSLGPLLVARRLPLLHAALPHVGHTQTRNRGTVVGSIVHADPAEELPLVAVCLDALPESVGPRGHRALAAADLYLGYLTTDLAEDEVAAAVRFPAKHVPVTPVDLAASMR